MIPHNNTCNKTNKPNHTIRKRKGVNVNTCDNINNNNTYTQKNKLKQD